MAHKIENLKSLKISNKKYTQLKFVNYCDTQKNHDFLNFLMFFIKPPKELI